MPTSTKTLRELTFMICVIFSYRPAVFRTCTQRKEENESPRVHASPEDSEIPVGRWIVVVCLVQCFPVCCTLLPCLRSRSLCVVSSETAPFSRAWLSAVLSPFERQSGSAAPPGTHPARRAHQPTRRTTHAASAHQPDPRPPDTDAPTHAGRPSTRRLGGLNLWRPVVLSSPPARWCVARPSIGSARARSPTRTGSFVPFDWCRSSSGVSLLRPASPRRL